MARLQQGSQRGFTLVETLVALMIFSVVALSGVVILRLAINSAEQLQASSKLARDFQLARSFIKADLSQLRGRTARDDLGNLLPGPVAGGNYTTGGLPREEDGERLLLALTRAGNTNPGNRLARSGLQYVEYLVIDESRIVRRARNFPDAAEETPHTDRVLFDGVSDVEIRFLSGPLWQEGWISAGSAVAPRLVEISFVHPVLGDMSQRFYIGRLDLAAGSAET